MSQHDLVSAQTSNVCITCIGIGTHFLVGGPYYPSQGSVGTRIKEVLYVLYNIHVAIPVIGSALVRA